MTDSRKLADIWNEDRRRRRSREQAPEALRRTLSGEAFEGDRDPSDRTPAEQREVEEIKRMLVGG